MEEIIKKIKEFDTIIIHGHMRPDGDCYGSQFGLKEIIKESFPNKKVYVVGGKCDYAAFLGQMDEIDDSLYNDALAIVVDTATAERVSDNRFTLAKYVIKIDHHIPVDNYGDYQYVLEEKSSCCEIIANLYLTHKDSLKINLAGATALYTGMVTDTGRFRFDCVNGETMRTAGALLDLGVDICYIDNNLSVETINTLKLKGYVLSNFVTTENGFVYIKITRDVVEKYNVTDEEAANQVSTIGTIEGYPVWALFMEYPNEIRIRLRSRGPEIDKLANNYGGGGHAKASGAKLVSWDQLNDFVKDADELVKNYKKSEK